jgi:chromate transporter
MEGGRKKRDWRLLLEIFLSTLKIGAITIGGGLAMVAVIEREFSGRKKWVNAGEMLDIIAVSQSLPGVIAINCSVMTGYRVAGIPGAIAASLGVTLPSLVTIMVIFLFYKAFRADPWVNAAFRGVSIGVAALLVSVVARMGKQVIKDGWVLTIAAAVLCASLFADVNAVLLIVLGGALGLSLKLGGAA